MYGYGYILLDPEIGANKPLVFKDREDTTYNYVGNNKNIKFINTGSKNKQNSASQYIIAEVSDMMYSYLYYYRKPFCSMMETTMKPSLLKFQHSRKKFYYEVVKVASFTAHVGLADPKGVQKKSDETVYDVEFKFLEPSNSLLEYEHKTLRNSFLVMNVSIARQYLEEVSFLASVSVII